MQCVSAFHVHIVSLYLIESDAVSIVAWWHITGFAKRTFLIPAALIASEALFHASICDRAHLGICIAAKSNRACIKHALTLSPSRPVSTIGRIQVRALSVIVKTLSTHIASCRIASDAILVQKGVDLRINIWKVTVDAGWRSNFRD